MEQYNAIWSSAPPPRKQFDVKLINENRFDIITFPQCESKFIYTGDARATGADRKASSETALLSWVRRGMRTEERFIFNSEFSTADSAGSGARHHGQSLIPHWIEPKSPRCFSNHERFYETCNRTVPLDLGKFLLLFSAFSFVNRKKSLNRVTNTSVSL